MAPAPSKAPPALAVVLLLGTGCPRASEPPSGPACPPVPGVRASPPAARAPAEAAPPPTTEAGGHALLPDLSWLLTEPVRIEIHDDWMVGIGSGNGFSRAILLLRPDVSKTGGIVLYAVDGRPAPRRPPRSVARLLDFPIEPTKRFLAALASPKRRPEGLPVVTHTDTYESVEVTVSTVAAPRRVARWRTTTNRRREHGLQWSLEAAGESVELDSGVLNEAYKSLESHLHLDEARRLSHAVVR